MDAVLNNHRHKLNPQSDTSNEKQLVNIINHYRSLISKPGLSRSEEKSFREISGFFHELWITPFEKYMKGINSLLIVPDGILGTIFFETLTNSKKQYLIEKYNITYAQSLMIAERTYERKYPADRKPLLALGGAEYAMNKTSEKSAELSENIEGIRNQADQILKREDNTRALYSRMGYTKWKNLPGTLKEVETLSNIIPESDIKTGKNL